MKSRDAHVYNFWLSLLAAVWQCLCFNLVSRSTVKFPRLSKHHRQFQATYQSSMRQALKQLYWQYQACLILTSNRTSVKEEVNIVSLLTRTEQK